MKKNTIFIIITILIFFGVLLVHWWFVGLRYFETIPSIIAVIELLVLVVLSILLIVRDYKNILVYAVVVLIFLGFFYFAIDTVNSFEIKVTDPFGEPLPDIAVEVKDFLGDEMALCPEGCSSIYRHIGSDIYYLTDENGIVIIPRRFYFGQRKMKYISGTVNPNQVFEIVSVRMNQGHDPRPVINSPDYKGERIFIVENEYKRKAYLDRTDSHYVHVGNKAEVTLSPNYSDTIDYKECLKLSDLNNKSECLLYSAFYYAVVEGNGELCELYFTDVNIWEKKILTTNRVFGIGAEELAYECYILVEGLMKNNQNACEHTFPNILERRFDYNDCICLFDKEKCSAQYNMNWERIISTMEKSPTGVHDAICAEEKSGFSYAIPYMKVAPQIYGKLFCN